MAQNIHIVRLSYMYYETQKVSKLIEIQQETNVYGKKSQSISIP